MHTYAGTSSESCKSSVISYVVFVLCVVHYPVHILQERCTCSVHLACDANPVVAYNAHRYALTTVYYRCNYVSGVLTCRLRGNNIIKHIMAIAYTWGYVTVCTYFFIFFYFIVVLTFPRF